MLTNPRYCLRILLAGLFWLLPATVPAEESIARLEQVNRTFESGDNAFRITVHSLAWLANITVGKFKIAELSGLAWDTDEGLLYALSDNGYVLFLRPVIQDRQLQSLLMTGGVSLLDENGRALRYKPSDSEGLALLNHRNGTQGDTEFLVSFERLPRIMRYKPDGTILSELPLPEELADISRYQSENKSLESVAVHHSLGVVTGIELPLNDDNSERMYIYDLSGKPWSFTPYNTHYGSLVGMDTMADGQIIALERAYGGLFPRMEITLHQLEPAAGETGHRIIYTFNPDDEMFDENFEGITRYEGDDYFMISDDNNNPFNRTLLVYFSIEQTGKERSNE